MGEQSFGPSERIRLDRDFDRLLKQGRRSSHNLWTLVWSDRPSPERAGSRVQRRFAVRVPRRAGNAVARNRIKRILREAFRLEKANLRPGTDLLILIRPQEAPAGPRFSRFRDEFVASCKKAGLWTGEDPKGE